MENGYLAPLNKYIPFSDQKGGYRGRQERGNRERKRGERE
jgi:hypothetical protein